MIRIYHARILTMEEDQDIFDGKSGFQGQRYNMQGQRRKKKQRK